MKTRRRRKLSTAVKSGCNEEEGEYEAGKPRYDDFDAYGYEEDLPFGMLVLRVAAGLACLALVLGMAYTKFVGPIFPPMTTDFDLDDDDGFDDAAAMAFTAKDSGEKRIEVSKQEEEANGGEAHGDAATTPPPLPKFNLSEYARENDAWAIAAKNDLIVNNNNTLFWNVARGLRERFTETYANGDTSVARGIVDAAVSTTPSATQITACRMHHRRKDTVFRMAFGGYSVTAGHGNRFSQSFPMVLEKLLETSISVAVGLRLQVRNAAIGGSPSFPYGWCLPQLLDAAPDVVSWDFSMNEAGDDPTGLEAYVRHVLYQFPHSQLVVKDTHMAVQRRDLLLSSSLFNGGYADHLQDPLLLHTDPAVDPFLLEDEEHRPPGFRQWREFGSPPGAPGQSLHHPAAKEHEFIAWILALYYLSALEVLVAEGTEGMTQKCASLLPQNKEKRPPKLGPPKHYSNRKDDGDEETIGESLFVGEARPTADTTTSTWFLNTVRCRTTFQPVVSGNLRNVIASGSVADDIDVMLPKSNMFYGKGWVFDLSEAQKTVQRKLERFGGLGFVDRKPSYYGIVNSGPLVLQLPLQQQNSLLKSVALCEVNELRDSDACNNVKDIQYQIGNTTLLAVSMDDTPTQYLGHSLCVYLQVPKHVATDSIRCSSAATQSCTVNVTLAVRNQHINRRDKACSISHVIWEEGSSDIKLNKQPGNLTTKES